MYYQTTYIKHLLTATNQHGVHSPFVYNFLTKGLYVKSTIKGSKTETVLLKSIEYFSVSRITLSTLKPSLQKLLQQHIKTTLVEEAPFDLIHFGYPELNVLPKYKDQLHNNTAIFIENIHRDAKATEVWNTILKNPEIHVSIDLFYCGLLFFREEQAKQHFKIRI